MGAVDGFSAQCDGGACLSELAQFIPNKKLGLTSAGEIRAAGGNIVRTPGFGHHVTVTNLPGEVAGPLLREVTNPKPAEAMMLSQANPLPVDFNNRDEDGAVRLVTRGVKEFLLERQIDLAPGMGVFMSDGELMAVGRVVDRDEILVVVIYRWIDDLASG